MKRFFRTGLIAIGLALSAANYGQPGPQPFHERLLGDWRGTGKVMGAASQLHMQWEMALGGKFVRLTFHNEMTTASGKQRFEGHAYYQSKSDGHYSGRWFDSSGDAHPINGIIEGDALIANWGTAETKEGRTIYRLLGAGKMEVIDSIRSKDGSWREFGRSTFVRQ